MSDRRDFIPGVTFHARDRLLDHYGLVADSEEWRAAVLAILDRTALLVRSIREPGGEVVSAEVYAVSLGGSVVEVAWRPESGVIVTVLPPDSRSLQTRRFRARRTRRSFEARLLAAAAAAGDDDA